MGKVAAAGFTIFSTYFTLNGIREMVTHNDLVNAGISGLDLYYRNTPFTHCDIGIRLLAFAAVSGVSALACYLSGRRGNACLENQDVLDYTASHETKPV